MPTILAKAARCGSGTFYTWRAKQGGMDIGRLKQHRLQ